MRIHLCPSSITFQLLAPLSSYETQELKQSDKTCPTVQQWHECYRNNYFLIKLEAHSTRQNQRFVRSQGQ